MGLIRLLLFLLAAWLAWRLYRSWRAKASRPRPAPPLAREPMVKCAHCGVHLPVGQALLHEQEHFCSPEHRRRHLDNQGRD